MRCRAICWSRPARAFVERQDLVPELRWMVLEGEQGIDDGAELAGLDEGFAGEAHEAVQIIGGDADDAVGDLGGGCGL